MVYAPATILPHEQRLRQMQQWGGSCASERRSWAVIAPKPASTTGDGPSHAPLPAPRPPKHLLEGGRQTPVYPHPTRPDLSPPGEHPGLFALEGGRQTPVYPLRPRWNWRSLASVVVSSKASWSICSKGVARPPPISARPPLDLVSHRKRQEATVRRERSRETVRRAFCLSPAASASSDAAMLSRGRDEPAPFPIQTL
jgi:hypothetical protein